MNFMDSYKRLEKLCGEIMNDNNGITAYIKEMETTPSGDFYIKGWRNDLNKLKHYRRVRNQIVHDPNCNEQTMCTPDDALWLENFHTRILNQSDPLSLYLHTVKASPKKHSTAKKEPKPVPRDQSPKTSTAHSGCFYFFITALCAILIIIFLIILFIIFKLFHL